MKITADWLQEHHAILALREWVAEQRHPDLFRMATELTRTRHNRFTWANWLLTEAMSYAEQVTYAAYGAEHGVGLLGESSNLRLRQAIEAARLCVERPSHEAESAAGKAAEDMFRYIEELPHPPERAPFRVVVNAAYAAAAAACRRESPLEHVNYAYEATIGVPFVKMGREKRDIEKHLIAYAIRLMKGQGMGTEPT